MKKELFIVVIIGIAIGFIVTYGIWQARIALKKLPAPQTSQTTPTPASTKPDAIKLNLFQPKENDLYNNEKIIVSGESLPNAKIVILTETSDFDLSTDETGKFSQEISLSGGINNIQIIAFDQSGREASQNLSVVYSTAQL